MHEVSPVFDIFNCAVFCNYSVGHIVIAAGFLNLLVDNSVDFFNIFGINDRIKISAGESYKILRGVTLKNFCDLIAHENNIFSFVSFINKQSPGHVSGKLANRYAVVFVEHEIKILS